MSTASVYRHGRAARVSNAGLATFIAVLLAGFVLVSPARAGDVESAKRHLAEARDDLQNQNWKSLDENLKSAEEFLEGVPDAQRKPVEAELEAVRKEGEPKIKAFRSERIAVEINRDVDSAARDVQDAPADVLNNLKAISEKLESEDARKYLEPEVGRKAKDRIAGLHAMAVKGAKKRVLETVKPLMDELEQQVASEPFKGKSQSEVYSIGQSIEGAMSRIRRYLEPIPESDPDVKNITDRLVALEKKVEEMGGASEKTEAIDYVAKIWERAKEDFAGWESEPSGPTWERYTKEGSTEMSALLMPKTIAALERTRYWLQEDEQVKKARAMYADDAKLKGIVDQATRTHDGALAKVNAAYNKLLDEADKLPTPGKSDLGFEKPRYIADEAKRWFRGTKHETANADRATKLYEKWTSALAADEKARLDLFNKMVEQATAAWPGIDAKIEAEDGFNPAEADKWKGRTVRIKGVYNRSGWDWTGYPLAITIDGMPVAGRYAANVKAALDGVYEKTRMSPDDHERWDVIAVVQGAGKISERTRTDIKNGGTVVGRLEGSRSVDCVVVEVVGLHAGPVAIGPGMTASASVNAGGKAGANSGGAVVSVLAGSGGSGALGWGRRILSTLLLLSAAGVAFVKARPAAFATAAGAPSGAGGTAAVQTGPAAALLAGDTPGYVGAAFVAIGVLQLLAGLVIGDLLPAAAFIAGGAYVAADLLRARGVMNETLYERVRGLGVPVAAAAAMVAVLHLALGAHWLF